MSAVFVINLAITLYYSVYVSTKDNEVVKTTLRRNRRKQVKMKTIAKSQPMLTVNQENLVCTDKLLNTCPSGSGTNQVEIKCGRHRYCRF